MKYLVFAILIIPLTFANVFFHNKKSPTPAMWSGFWIGMALMLILSDIFPE